MAGKPPACPNLDHPCTELRCARRIPLCDLLRDLLVDACALPELVFYQSRRCAAQAVVAGLSFKMIRVLGTAKQVCDGFSRREMLRVGGLSLLGLSLEDLLRAEQARDGAPARGKAKSVILLYLFGGPAVQETFDPKPNAPLEFRGEFGSIPTSVPGVHFCEHLPRMAKWMHRSTLIRSATHDMNDHSAGLLYTMTGAPPDKLESLVPTLSTQAPSMNSVIEYLARHERRTMPASVWMPCYPGWGQKITRPGPFAGWLGRRWDPLITDCELRENYIPKDFYDVQRHATGRRSWIDRRGQRRANRRRNGPTAEVGDSGLVLRLDTFQVKE